MSAKDFFRHPFIRERPNRKVIYTNDYGFWIFFAVITLDMHVIEKKLYKVNSMW